MNSTTFTSALTIDVEDGINILMRDIFNVEMQPTERVIKNVELLLDLFQSENVKGTFFVLGEIAEHYPKLVKEISSAGHELGVHGYHHDQIFKLTPQKAANDIKRAKELIEDVTGKRVYGFRAPAFSISEKTSWIFEILSNLGFTYDSSIVPAKTGRYGWPGFGKKIQRLSLQNGNSIIEVPMSVTDMLGRSVPACGGGYLRYFPYSFTKRVFQKTITDRPAVLYLHPYEIDVLKYPDYFYDAKAKLPLKKRLPLSLYRMNKNTVKEKLRKLLIEFEFKPMIDIISDYEVSHDIKIVSL